MDDETFDPPNDGTWELDTTHMSRPISWFARAALVSGMPRGFSFEASLTIDFGSRPNSRASSSIGLPA